MTTSDSDRARWTETASRIGAAIVDDAMWSGRRCNWVGRVPDDREATLSPAYSTLGSDLYGGVAGVALFLAELAAKAPDAALITTASAAARLAVDHAETVEPATRWGVYTGWPGIALAALRVGIVAGDDELVDAARRLVRRLEGEQNGDQSDVISGSAGAIIGLIALERLGLDVSSSLYQRLAEHLLAGADRDKRGACWIDPLAPANQPLTGMSHGVAGVAGALAMAGRRLATGRLLALAEDALAYEDSWWDADAANWADLREVRRGRLKVAAQAPKAIAWCHGAPGIALARVAAGLAGADQARGTATDIGLRTTTSAIGDPVDASARISLCHGWYGNALVVLHALDRQPDRPAVVAAIGAALNDPARMSGWSVEGTESDSPSLMLGMAGIGYAFLAAGRGVDVSPVWLPSPIAPLC